MKQTGAAAESLGKEGAFRHSIAGFVSRPSQQEMAAAVESSLADKATLLVEAGTGTGKTFSYLVPALQSGLRVAVSTGTRNLQDQLFHRDLPQVCEVLASPARVALLKGRSNYLCLHRLDRALHDPRQLRFRKKLADLRRWSRETRDGELARHGEHSPALAAAVTSTADNCLGNKCPDYENCFVLKARRKAQAADIVVVNHHLLLSDFRLREEGFGVLPGVQAVVVDEAHQLPDLAPQFFGERLSTRQLQDLARDVSTEVGTQGDIPDLLPLATALVTASEEASTQLFANVEGRVGWKEFSTQAQSEAVHAAVGEALKALACGLEPLVAKGPELAHLAGRTGQLLRAHAALTGTDGPEGWVRWAESAAGGGRGGSWHGAPIETADAFKRLFAAYPGSWIFTSATLSGDAEFTDFRRALGVPEAQGLRLGSPFDYARQARLYLPDGLPQPSDPTYPQAVAQSIQPLIEAGQGGAMVLCTSHRAVRLISASLRQKSQRIPGQILVQGEAPKAVLVERFTQDGHAVLVATSSFWEGVDIKGPALRMVVIDKLPFQARGDPIFEARLEALARAGQQPFPAYQLPHMIVSLRQGVGRLIRDETDTGLVVLCDPRLRSRGYGKRALRSLPGMPQIRDEKDACQWMSAMCELADVG